MCDIRRVRKYLTPEVAVLVGNALENSLNYCKCLEICPVSISTSYRVIRIHLLVLSQIIESTLMFKITTPVYIFNKVVLLPIFGHSCLSAAAASTRRSNPDRQYLKVPPFQPPVYKSVKHFSHSFVFNVHKI